jgi:hypothetical protein
MPGGFLMVVGGDLSEIGRHSSSRSPRLKGKAYRWNLAFL